MASRGSIARARTSSVLDASAILAYLFDETGAEVVEEYFALGAIVSAVNFAEVACKLADVHPTLAQGLPLLERLASDPAMYPTLQTSLGTGAPVLPETFTIEPFTLGDAVICAVLRPVTRPAGLSLGDRACLSLGRRLGKAVVTADQSWVSLDQALLGVDVVLIR